MKSYIIPSGWEKEIILKSIYKSGADKVYLITSEAEDSKLENINVKTRNTAYEIKKELSNLAEIELVTTNYVDFFGSFKKISSLIQKEKRIGNSVSVNIAGGNKLLASALLMAAFLHKIPVLYSVPEEYDEELLLPERPLRKGLMKVFEIPALPLNFNFTRKEKEILNLICSKCTIGVKDYLETFPYTNENRARARFSYYINKLKEASLIEVKDTNGKRTISLSETGKVVSGVIEKDSIC